MKLIMISILLLTMISNIVSCSVNTKNSDITDGKQSEYQEKGVQINSLVQEIKDSDIDMKKINIKVFDASLKSCTTFKPQSILSDTSWVFYKDDNIIASAREFEFADIYQATRFRDDTSRIAKVFYETPRHKYGQSEWMCWPEFDNKFYIVIQEGVRVMLIGDGDQYNYSFEKGDSIKDYHLKTNTKFIQFLNQLNQSYTFSEKKK